ncbi:hypothetical protein ACEWY4_010067 [Coilia grayii]|uniref:Peptidase S1 domain-containing protein n=1 Tax=Coilia grayii TaxID=363190 RepID=A0ABD1K876_9TELE
MNVCRALCVAVVLLFWTLGVSAQLDVCGHAPLNTRIVGGQDALAGAWPWQASLNCDSPFCGGSLINKDWVLTAAHCFSSFSASEVVVYLGRQSQEGSNPNEVSRNVSEIIIHPDYNTDTGNNNIALVRLSSPVTFTDYIRPICLAAATSIYHTGTSTWVTGWGTIGLGVALPSPQTLQAVKVPVVSSSDCNHNYITEGLNITSKMMCAGLLEEGGKDPCQGDCGGPLVSRQGSVWVQAGIVSFSIACGIPQFPGVYARVSEYQSWITDRISSDQPGFVTFTGGSGAPRGIVSLSLSLTLLPFLFS